MAFLGNYHLESIVTTPKRAKLILIFRKGNLI